MTVATTLSIPQGATWAVAFPVLTEGFDPAGWTVRAEIRERVSSAVPVLVWPSAGAQADFEDVPADQLRQAGYVVPDGVPTVLCAVLRLDPVVSTAWQDTWSVGVFDVEAVAGNGGTVVRLARGSVVVEREITRSA